MCKPKNKVMCPDCGKQKILFESESKANNFIKFNKDEIRNGNKLRSYYCPACCGWHVSHMTFHKEMTKRTDKLIEAYNKEQELKHIRNIPYINDIVDELYQEIKRHALNDRKSVNQLLYRHEYSNYSSFVKQEAKVRYYKENNI